MRVSILISGAAVGLLVWGSAWARQEQQQGQSQQANQQSASQSQKQVPAPQQNSLAAAARKAREQRKEAPKNVKVFTNDNIPTAGGISSVGEEEEPKKEEKPGETSGGANSGSAKSGSASSEEAAWRSRFAKLRHKLEQDQADLDLMQRELGVLSTEYYSDPNKQLQQQLSREDINKKTADIEARKKDVEADKRAISDAEDELRKAGGDPGWANPQ
jgi:lipopolysaccharide export LptBFGC system permease protein LptF